MRRKIIILFILNVFVFFWGEKSWDQSPLKAGPLVKPTLREKIIRNWTCVYSEDADPTDLVKFDLAVLDADSHPPLAGLKEKDTILLGYVSIGEVESFRWYWPEIQGKSWILGENPNWKDDYFIDVRDSEWHDYLIKKVIPKILNDGFEGLFLDTLDTAAHLEGVDPKKYAGAKKGMVNLVKKIRAAFPQILIFPNNGFSILEEIAPYISGVVAEDISSMYDFETSSYVKVSENKSSYKINILKRLKKESQLPILTLDYALPSDHDLIEYAYSRAKSLGFLPYVSTVDLDQIFFNPSFSLSPGLPLTIPLTEKEFKRAILALYDSSDGRTENINEIHDNAEMVLNYLGLKVQYYDISSGIPPAEFTEGFRGIITWFLDEELDNPVSYCRWLQNQVSLGKRLVILENFGASVDKKSGSGVPLEEINKVYHAIGLELTGEWTDNPYILQIAYKDPKMVEFERSLKNELTFYQKVSSIDPQNRVYLKLRRTDLKDSTSDAVVTTRNGGFVLSTYVYYQHPETFKTQWRINPFDFFREAFGLRDAPRLDTTTLNGSRIFYSHIDGDGFVNISEIDRKSFSAEIIRDEILKRYHLPITVSVIVARQDPEALGNDKSIKVARDIFAMDHVEAGSHGFAHPLDWEKKTVAIQGIPNYQYDVKKEIDYSVNFINHYLLPQGKKVKIFLWTGACNPPQEALKRVYDLGIKNLNGGDSIFDPDYPSYTYVAPLTRQVGNLIQFYTSNANENIYTNLWTEPFYGFKNVIHTFKNTERPRRISPINVYYHHYSGEKLASLNALKMVYDWVIKQDVAPIFASQYVEVVEGFLSGRVFRRNDGSWKISNNGQCRTIRFDDSSRYPNLKKSKGILGFSHYQGSLYIYLNEADTHIIYLTDVPPAEVYLNKASCYVERWVADRKRVSFAARGIGRERFKISNLPPHKSYRIKVEGKAAEFMDLLTTNAQGNLYFEGELEGKALFEIKEKLP